MNNGSNHSTAFTTPGLACLFQPGRLVFAFAVAFLFVTPPSLCAQAVPQQRSTTHYNVLIQNSPFTIRPQQDLPPELNPLQDWALTGVANVGSKSFALLQNTKSKNVRVTVVSGEKNPQGLEILQVMPGMSYKDTKVRIRAQGKEGWIAFDDRHLKLEGIQLAQPVKGGSTESKRQLNPNGNHR